MGCPDCGCASRKLISVGYWECASPKRLVLQQIVTDLASGQPRPIYSEVLQPCGLRYQQVLQQRILYKPAV